MNPLDKRLRLTYAVRTTKQLSRDLDDPMRFAQPLNTILNSEVKVRILRFFCRHGGEWNGRQVAAQLALHPTTAHKALRELHLTTVLNFRKIGNNFVYSLRDDHYLVRAVLRPQFQREAKAFEQLMQRLRQRLPAALRSQIVSLALYGSVVRGQERPTSDVDLLVLVTTSQVKRAVDQALERLWRPALDEFGNSIAPYINTVAEARRKVRQGMPVFQAILKQHQLLWGRPLKEVLHGRAA